MGLNPPWDLLRIHAECALEFLALGTVKGNIYSMTLVLCCSRIPCISGLPVNHTDWVSPCGGGSQVMVAERLWGRKWELSLLSWDRRNAVKFTGCSWWLHLCLGCKTRPWEQETGHYTHYPQGELKVQRVDSSWWYLETQYHRLC